MYATAHISAHRAKKFILDYVRQRTELAICSAIVWLQVIKVV
jgi:hypothetical protein